MTTTTITITCAWCNAPMGSMDGQGVSGVSHGACQPCVDKMLAEIAAMNKTNKESSK